MEAHRSHLSAAPSEGHLTGVVWMTEVKHNGRSIQLKSIQRHDGTWGCSYTILEIGATRISSVTRYDNGTFPTREEGEAAALDAAQVEIDSRGTLI